MNEYIAILENAYSNLKKAILQDIADWEEAIGEPPTDVFFHSIEEMKRMKDNKEATP